MCFQLNLDLGLEVRIFCLVLATETHSLGAVVQRPQVWPSGIFFQWYASIHIYFGQQGP